jgi:hypothetical protein
MAGLRTKAGQDSRTPRLVGLRTSPGPRGSVLECGCPLPLWASALADQVSIPEQLGLRLTGMRDCRTHRADQLLVTLLEIPIGEMRHP